MSNVLCLTTRGAPSAGLDYQDHQMMIMWRGRWILKWMFYVRSSVLKRYPECRFSGKQQHFGVATLCATLEIKFEPILHPSSRNSRSSIGEAGFCQSEATRTISWGCANCEVFRLWMCKLQSRVAFAKLSSLVNSLSLQVDPEFVDWSDKFLFIMRGNISKLEAKNRAAQYETGSIYPLIWHNYC